jgi:hypothetical protein
MTEMPLKFLVPLAVAGLAAGCAAAPSGGAAPSAKSGLRPGLKLPEGPGSYPGPFSAINSGTAAFVGYTPPVGYGVAPLEMVSDRGHVLTRAGNVATINEPFAAAFLSSARGWVAGENLRTHVFSIQVTTNSGRTWATQYTTR